MLKKKLTFNENWSQISQSLSSFLSNLYTAILKITTTTKIGKKKRNWKLWPGMKLKGYVWFILFMAIWHPEHNIKYFGVDFFWFYPKLHCFTWQFLLSSLSNSETHSECMCTFLDFWIWLFPLLTIINGHFEIFFTWPPPSKPLLSLLDSLPRQSGFQSIFYD